MVDDYITRARHTGRALGIRDVTVSAHEAKTSNAQLETDILLNAIPTGAHVWVLDERGKALPTPRWAQNIDALKANGCSDMCFLIGGADGHTDQLRKRADKLISFGPNVWPHKLVRVMVAEQIYRALSILAGHPYHRT